ncbi:MAG: hypothetical protein DWG76_07485 [Chloroflexi bacterium]|nr:hypothetical protein [Chloroflexota bacterium]
MPLGNDLLSISGVVVAAILTLITLSYIIEDHALFRLVLHLFVGVAAGYAGAVAIEEILIPQFILPLQGQLIGVPQIGAFDLIMRTGLTLLLLTKLWPRTAVLGNPVSAMLVGIGAALAIGGAVQGTILPQVAASSAVFDLDSFDLALQGGYYAEGTAIILQGLITLLATIGTLAYFHFGARSRGNLPPERAIFVDVLAWIGRVFIPITLAVLFSGVLLAALTALIERLDFLINVAAYFLGS